MPTEARGAIKILPAAFSSGADRLQRFQQEERVLRSVNHNNLLAILDVGNQNGSDYLVSGREISDAGQVL
jgi:serine/threonine protein kinase